MQQAHNKSIIHLGIDAGGTFTDFVVFKGEQHAHLNWQIHKVLSTPDDPSKAIFQGIEELGLNDTLAEGRLAIVHGSTVATNAALERKGARTVYIANKGFKDVLTIGRQARRELYNLFPKPTEPPVPPELCIEVDCRRDAVGQEIKPLDSTELDILFEKLKKLKPEAIAINLLFSFLNDEEERLIEAKLKSLAFTSRSSKVLPLYKEYERGMATWLNASLSPKVSTYLKNLKAGFSAKNANEDDNDHGQAPISIMQSSGGTMSVDQASERAVNLLLSGPAGGLAAVKQLGQQCEFPRIISFDMGGTSTDVALMDGDFQLTTEATINHWPIAVPMLSMETIGAGGGSIAWLDQAGMLHVGPQSAGSEPGPVCYGKGGTDITVTDANLFLGRLQADSFLGGHMMLDIDATKEQMFALSKRAGIDPDQLALGIIQLAEQQMVQALHAISVKKGHDPSNFQLCCFGGAGGMHVCSLAEQMGIDQALVPHNSGVLSALGMLCAPKKRYLTRTFTRQWSDMSLDEIKKELDILANEALVELKGEVEDLESIKTIFSLDMRYTGQSYCLNVPFSQDASDRFISAHEKQYGHSLDKTVELVNICVELKAENNMTLPKIETEQKPNQCPSKCIEAYGVAEPVSLYQRNQIPNNLTLDGPAIICEHVSTTWIKPGWTFRKDDLGNLILKK